MLIEPIIFFLFKREGIVLKYTYSIACEGNHFRYIYNLIFVD